MPSVSVTPNAVWKASMLRRTGGGGDRRTVDRGDPASGIAPCSGGTWPAARAGAGRRCARRGERGCLAAPPAHQPDDQAGQNLVTTALATSSNAALAPDASKLNACSALIDAK